MAHDEEPIDVRGDEVDPHTSMVPQPAAAMLDRSVPRSGSAAISRRRLLARGATAGLVVWTVPTIMSMPAAATTGSCDPSAPPTLTMGASTTFLSPSPTGNTASVFDTTAIPPGTMPISFVWAELGPVTLASPVSVDATGPGTWTILNTAGAAIVPTGTTVFSYYVHTRRQGALPSAYFAGSLSVPSGYVVVGMAFRAPAQSPSTLISTAALQSPGLVYRYNTNNGEGYEPGLYSGNMIPPPAYVPASITRDTVIIASNGTVSWFAFTGGTFSDDFRLLVAADC